jgi:4-alpha-glucanotransferase
MREIHFEHAQNYEHALWLAALESGIDAEYWDIFHQRHELSSDARRLILRSLGYPVDSFEALEDARRKRFEMRAARPVAPSVVLSEHGKWVPLSIRAGENPTLRYELWLEDGTQRAGEAQIHELYREEDLVFYDRRWTVYRLPLPGDVPLGYHHLKVFLQGGEPVEASVAICPDRAYLPEALAAGGRTAGFNVTLYGLRSERNWGCGDFTDVRALLDWAGKEAGFSFIGLNPLHALHNRVPYNTSPYLPLSVFYKNLIYIDIESVPEFRQSRCAQAFLASPKVQEQLRGLREAPFVEYSAVDRLKRRFLKMLYRQFRRDRQSQRAAAFRAYCEREGDLLWKFALYCALDETLHKQDRNCWTWRDWPGPYQNPGSPETQAFAREHGRLVEFYQYIQFVLEEQLSAAQQYARDAGLSIGLYHDLAVATDSFGSDLWAHREFFANGCRVGAPPDDFSPKGQDWGFPPPNKEAHRNSGYRLYRESIRKIVRHGGALRIDHVMRLYRLFWIPDGMEPWQGAYVRDYAEDLMHLLALESVRSRNIIIGEDLGTVTDEMRALFSRFGILSYRLFPFEKNYQTGEFKHSFEYPRQALVSSSTHDLPTLAGFWSGQDIQARREAGLADDAGYERQQQERRTEKQRMLDTLHSEALLPDWYTRDAGNIHELDGELHNAVIGFLAQVPSVLLLLNHEDFTKQSQQQNLPGSTEQYPNWRSKMGLSLEQLGRAESRPYTDMFAYHLKRTGRA